MERERVVILSGNLEGRIFEIAGPLLIGRNPDSAIQLDDLQVSRRHAVIERTASGTVVKDLGSGNGTFVRDRRILEYRLSDGDIVQIGPVQLRYERSAEPDQRETEKMEASNVRFERELEGTLQASSAANVYETFFTAPQGAVTRQQLEAVQKRLQAVYEANQFIASERDLKKLFERVMDQIFALVPANNGVILLKEQKSGELETEYVKTNLGSKEVVISSTIVNRAFNNGEAVITRNAADDSRFEAGMSIIAQNIASVMCTPLLHQDETLGVLYVDTRGTTNAFVEGDLEMLVALAGPAAIAIKNAQYLHKLEMAYHDTLIALANAIEMRDHYTVGHTWRVTNFMLAIAREMAWDEGKLKECEMGGVLHDVGKIAVDDAILRKPNQLTDEEYAKMKVHPERGALLMRDVEHLTPLIPYALYHHERYDGKGYPFGLAGGDIPIEGRLVAVADTFDAMTSNRPYRKGKDPEFAIQEIQKCVGGQFDPECVAALVKSYQDGKIARIMQDYLKGEKSVACPFCSTHIPLPEAAQVGAVFPCNVCHRSVRLEMRNEAYYGMLVSETDINPSTPVPGRTTRAG